MVEFDVSFLFSHRRLKPLDIEFMRQLHDKVNIIPLIAKADTMTPDECHRFKQQVNDLPITDNLLRAHMAGQFRDTKEFQCSTSIF